MGVQSIGTVASAATVASLRERISLLEEEVAQLREQLGYKDDPRWRRLGLSKSLARLLSGLLKQDVMSKSNGIHAVYFDDPMRAAEIDFKIIDVHICHLRQRLRPLGIVIDTVWGYGYSMTAADKDRVRAAFEAACA